MYYRIASLTVLFCTAAITPAHAQDASCFPRADILASLTNHFHETQVAVGLATSGIVEVFTTIDGSSWTIVISRPDGISCVVGAGQQWQAIQRPGTSL